MWNCMAWGWAVVTRGWAVVTWGWAVITTRQVSGCRWELSSRAWSCRGPSLTSWEPSALLCCTRQTPGVGSISCKSKRNAVQWVLPSLWAHTHSLWCRCWCQTSSAQLWQPSIPAGMEAPTCTGRDGKHETDPIGVCSRLHRIPYIKEYL